MTTIIKKKSVQKLELITNIVDKQREEAFAVPSNVPTVQDTLPQPVYTPTGWYGQVYLLNSVLQRMTARGIPVSPSHHANFSTTLKEAKRKLLTTIEELIEQREQEKGTSLFNDELGDDGRRMLPKKVREMLSGMAATQTVICRRKNKETGKFEMVEEEQQILPRYTTAKAKNKYPAFPEEYLEWFTQACEGLGYVWKIDKANRGVLAVKREFNPGSPDQLKAYCAWQGYKVPTSLKKTAKGKEEKQSVDDKALEELSKQYRDEIFTLIQDYRELDKLLGTYVPGWEPGKDGRVHSTFTFQPATGQLSSRSPNVQNAPSSGEFKKLIRADEGRVIVEFDYTGYHALMLGYFAKCPSYMRLSALGIHDFLAAHILKNKISLSKPEELATDLWQETIAHLADLPQWLSYDDKLLKTKLKWVKVNHPYVRNKQAKPAVHGIGFGMGVKKLYDMNKGSFKSLKEAEAVRGVMRGLFPEVFRFQDKIVEQAHRDKKIITPFGYVRRFWEAMTYKPGKGLVAGEDAEKVKAYLPANTAFAVKKCAMIRLEGLGANERYGLFNEVHDSLMYMPIADELEECIKVVVAEMTRPVPELGGLTCGVEVKYGPSWGETEEWKL